MLIYIAQAEVFRKLLDDDNNDPECTEAASDARSQLTFSNYCQVYQFAEREYNNAAATPPQSSKYVMMQVQLYAQPRPDELRHFKDKHMYYDNDSNIVIEIPIGTKNNHAFSKRFVIFLCCYIYIVLYIILAHKKKVNIYIVLYIYHVLWNNHTL